MNIKHCLVLATLTIPLFGGTIVPSGVGNDGRQCPLSPVLVPITVLDRAAPQNAFCFSTPPPLVGYLDPYNPAKDIVWTPIAEPFMILAPSANTITITQAPNGSSTSLFPTPDSGSPPPITTPPMHNTPEAATWQIVAAGMGTLALLRLILNSDEE